MAIGRTNAGASGGLNFKVVPGLTQPSAGRPNDIWVETDVKVPSYFFTPSDPFLKYKDVELSNGLTIKPGYFNDSGDVAKQDTRYFEMYTEEHIPVKYGKSYAWTYALSEDKAMWIAVVEYTGDKVFSKRTVLLTQTTAAYKDGVYTPSKATVTSVRLSWRGHNDEGCKVALIEKDVPYYPDSTPIGALWFKTGEESSKSFNALKRNTLMVFPVACYQFIDGGWVGKQAKMYRDGEWVNWIVYLYNAGDEVQAITGGWQARGLRLRSGASYTAKAPTLTKNDTYMTAVMNTTGASGVIEIVKDIDVSKYSTLYLEYSGKGLDNAYYFYWGVAPRDATYYVDDALACVNTVYSDASTENKVVALDISNVDQAVDVFFGLHLTTSASGTNTLNIHKVWLE